MAFYLCIKCKRDPLVENWKRFRENLIEYDDVYNSRIIKASPEKIYHAFTTREALEYWLAPNGMHGKIHEFKSRIGESYSVSLFYLDSELKGKTEKNEDRFSAKFIELKPNEKITQSILFDTTDESLKGEMIMETTLEEIADGFTQVTIAFKNIPRGIKPADNEAGTEQSLEKLARYVERSQARNIEGHWKPLHDRLNHSANNYTSELTFKTLIETKPLTKFYSTFS